MIFLHKVIGSAAAVVLAIQVAVAAEAPQEQRHELMEDVGGGAKTIGKMLEGFEAALQAWAEATDAAIAANPQDLESLQAAAGAVFKKCKACHQDYRVEKE